MKKRLFFKVVTDLAGKKSGKIGRGLLWLAAVILLLVGILFFAFTALVYQGQLPFGYQITLVEQSGCDIPLTDTLVLTQQQEQYSSGDSVVFFRQEKDSLVPDCGTLQQLEEGLGVVDQAGATAVLPNQAITGKILICFPTLGKLAVWVNGPAQSSLLFWVCIGLGVVLLGLSVLLMISAFQRGKESPLHQRSSQAAYQPEQELAPMKLFSVEPEALQTPSQSTPANSHYPSPEQLKDLPWHKLVSQEDVPLQKETPAQK